MSYRIAEEKYSLTYQQLELLDATARLTNACMLIMDLVQNRIVCRTEKLLFIDETTQHAIQGRRIKLRLPSIAYPSSPHSIQLSIVLD